MILAGTFTNRIIQIIAVRRTYALHHAIAGSLFLILSIITLREFIFGQSLFIYRDLLWPLDINSMFSNLWYTLDLESSRRIVYLGPFFMTSNLLGFSSLSAEKALFLITRFLTAFLAYLAIYEFSKSRISNHNKKMIFLISLFGGYFYAYNPIATTMISTTLAFALSYSLIPLIFYYFDKTLDNGKFQNVFITSTLISLCLAATTQFLVLLPLFVLIPWFIVICIYRGIRNIPRIFKNALGIILLSFLLSFYWVFVSLMISLQGVTLKPSYILTVDSLNTFSVGTSLLDVFRLMGDWWPRVPLLPIIDGTVWNILTFAIPIAMISFALFSKTSKLKFYLISMFLISLFIMFFHKGTQPPIPDFYPMLYDIPVVGWMFRIPSKIGMVLSFFVTMVISLGFYGFLSSGSGKKKLPKYAAMLCFLLIISVISWPMFTGDFGGVYKDNNKFANNGATNTNAEIGKIRAPSENIVVVGAYDKYDSLTSLDLPVLKNSSIIFADERLDTFKSHDLSAIDKIVLEDKDSLTMHFLPSDAVTVYPFTSTDRHDPANVWSKAGTSDPLHGPFHNYFVKQFPMSNSDIDYGKGVIITWSKDKLDIPVTVKADGLYDLNIRYLANVYGGTIKLSFDDNQMKDIPTKSQVNRFVWTNAGTINISQGQHILKLENNNGLNAINMLAIIPSAAHSGMEEQAKSIIEKSRNLFLVEAESDLILHGEGGTRNKDTLTLNGKSSAYSTLDILKASDYTFAVRTKTCEECSTVTINLDGLSKQLPLKSDKTEFRWFYFTQHVEPGSRKITFRTDNQVEIDKLIVYSDSHQGENLENLFSSKESSAVSYHQLDPTSYDIRIRDASNPVFLLFDQPYDPLWRLHDASGREFAPLEVYSNRIGFVVDEVGSFDVNLEYKPQQWFYIGSIVSAAIFLGSLAYIMLINRKKLPHLVNTIKHFSMLTKDKMLPKSRTP